jgi:Zn-dependent protease
VSGQQQPARRGLFGGSFSIGVVWGVDVQVHTLFVFWILYCMISNPSQVAWVLEWNLLLFGSVFLHEMGHCFGARQVGGVANRVILYPLGGLAVLKTPRTAWAEFVSTAAGPAVNLLLCVLGALLMVAGGILQALSNDPGSVFELIKTAPLLASLGGLIFGINLLLFMFNILPAFPMDGGRIFRAMLWPLFGWRTATLVATVTAMLFGGAFALLGLLVLKDLFLALIGGYVVMVSHMEFKRAQASRPPPPPMRPTDDRMPFER